MDYELFYEEIEGFDLYIKAEKIWQTLNLSNPVTEKLPISKTTHDSKMSSKFFFKSFALAFKKEQKQNWIF
jgi:hypothetical protein